MMKKITLIVTILIGGVVNNLHSQVNINEKIKNTSNEELLERFKGSNNHIDKNQLTIDERLRLTNYLKTKFQNQHLPTPSNNTKGTNAYCGPLVFSTAVEPITLVDFAGINNSTDATIAKSK